MQHEKLPPLANDRRRIVGGGVELGEFEAFEKFANSLGTTRSRLIRRYVRYVTGQSTELPPGLEQPGKAA